MEAFIIFVSAIVIGMFLFVALTLSSISRDLFRIRQILDNHERELAELRKKEYIETGKITH